MGIDNTAALRAISIGSPSRIQRFHVLVRVGDAHFDWLSQHRTLESALSRFNSLLPGDRADAVVFDVRLGATCAPVTEVKS